MVRLTVLSCCVLPRTNHSKYYLHQDGGCDGSRLRITAWLEDKCDWFTLRHNGPKQRIRPLKRIEGAVENLQRRSFCKEKTCIWYWFLIMALSVAVAGGGSSHSGSSQSEWLSRKRHMDQLSRCQIAWRWFLLHQKRKFFCLLCVLMCTLMIIHSGLTTTNNIRNTIRGSQQMSPVQRKTKKHKLPPALPSFPPSPQSLEQLNAQFDGDPDQVLLWAAKYFPQSLMQVTSFGASGMVLLDKMHRLGLLSQVPVLSIDTLHLFDETHSLISNVQKKYQGMDLHIYRPLDFESREAFDAAFGADLYQRDPEKYGYLTKVEPMERALEEHNIQAWITGRRRSQGGERAHLPLVEYDGKYIKLNPLAMWTYDQVWDYIRNKCVPYNVLYDRGYKSIGDVMTSRVVAPDAPERSGRFVGLNQTECGMHAHLQKVERLRQEARDKEEEFQFPTLPCEDCHDVDLDTFQSEIVQATQRDILLEFYSPLCGACQEFSPTLNRIASKVKGSLQVSRFDITVNALTDEMVKQGFQVETTPTLYLVQHNPWRVSEYSGDHSEFSILEWLKQIIPDVRIS